jgi:hypothetical protein
MVSLVLKLFVSNRPLKLEGVLCIYVLLLHEGQVEYQFAMFFYMIETHTWLSMHYYSWSFVCVTFNVITWLLSFIVKIMSFMPMFRVLWSQHSMIYIVWSRLCWCMSPQKLLFCYHLPTRGRAWVKLGDNWYISNVSITSWVARANCAASCEIIWIFMYNLYMFFLIPFFDILSERRSEKKYVNFRDTKYITCRRSWDQATKKEH